MGLLVTPSRFFKPSRVRLVFLMLAGAAFVLTEFGRKVYRPYVRGRGIEDLGLADSIGNLGGILVQIFFTIAVVNATRRQCYALAVFLAAGYIVYEVLQPFLPRGTFDWKDVWGTLIGMVAAMGVVALVWRLNADEGKEP
jgi:hypothetical protein